MDWLKILKAGGEVAKIIGDILDDGKLNNSNRNNNNQNN